jgi:hypothetical protein
LKQWSVVCSRKRTWKGFVAGEGWTRRRKTDTRWVDSCCLNATLRWRLDWYASQPLAYAPLRPPAGGSACVLAGKVRRAAIGVLAVVGKEDWELPLLGSTMMDRSLGRTSTREAALESPACGHGGRRGLSDGGQGLYLVGRGCCNPLAWIGVPSLKVFVFLLSCCGCLDEPPHPKVLGEGSGLGEN